jgi:hypothetical protein
VTSPSFSPRWDAIEPLRNSSSRSTSTSPAMHSYPWASPDDLRRQAQRRRRSGAERHVRRCAARSRSGRRNPATTTSFRPNTQVRPGKHQRQIHAALSSPNSSTAASARTYSTSSPTRHRTPTAREAEISVLLRFDMTEKPRTRR